ncbi:hypothetical protein NC651_012611 [Populus alba x Populus x berolinensis]|nr:hypothetical protein NC651_012611 [Populus alba x Populus x berolinensis]
MRQRVEGINRRHEATFYLLTWTGSMGDQQGSWSRLVTSIAHRRGASLRSPQAGRACVKICGLSEGSPSTEKGTCNCFSEFCIAIKGHGVSCPNGGAFLDHIEL